MMTYFHLAGFLYQILYDRVRWRRRGSNSGPRDPSQTAQKSSVSSSKVRSASTYADDLHLVMTFVQLQPTLLFKRNAASISHGTA